MGTKHVCFKLFVRENIQGIELQQLGNMDMSFNKLFKSKSLLILIEVKKQIKNQLKIAIVPGGLTKLLQPLNISVNQHFKIILKFFGKIGLLVIILSQKAGTRKELLILKFVIGLQKLITSECIKNGFRKSTVEFYVGIAENGEDIFENEYSSKQYETPGEFLELFQCTDIKSNERFVM